MDASRLAKLTKLYPVAQLPTGNFRSGPVRLSFPNLFVAQPDDKGVMKFSTSLLFPKGADISPLRRVHAEMTAENFPGRNDCHEAFRDQGCKSFAGYEAGAYFTSCNSKKRPGLVGPDGKALYEHEEIYPGVWALVTIRPFVFGKEKGSKKWGISFGLQNVQKIADDEPFSGGPAASEEFAPLDASVGGEDAFSGHDFG